jgi:DNA-directed RNA polymerase subunit RPC12/RpoP
MRSTFFDLDFWSSRPDMGEIRDNRIRLNCTGCGKRFKVGSDKEGAAFRCPHCKTTLIVPSNGRVEIDAETDAKVSDFARRLKMRSDQVSGRLPGDATPLAPPPPQPTVAQPARPHGEGVRAAIDRLNIFLVREQKRIGDLSGRIVRDRRLPAEAKEEGLLSLRQQKAMSIRKFVNALVMELDSRLANLKSEPAADTETGKMRLEALQHERDGVALYLEVMFQMKSVGQDRQGHPAKPDTP